jgi:two-component system KDP operon response regulator KdpE
MSAVRVLVVDDERPIRRFLRTALAAADMEVAEAASGEEGLTAAAAFRPDVIVLDLGLPDLDGVEVIRRLREWSRQPIVVLSVRDREDDKVEALDAGADDYLTKPFGVGELLARIRAALRRAAAPAEEPVFRAGGLEVDLARRRVRRDEVELTLTPTEYDLLRVFVRHAGRVLTHRQILREVWGPEYGDEAHYLRVYMAQLRRKLESDPARPRWLRTEVGVGYRLKTADEEG